MNGIEAVGVTVLVSEQCPIFEVTEEVAVGKVAAVEDGRVTEGVHKPLRNSLSAMV